MARQPWTDVRHVLAGNDVRNVDATLARLKRFVELLLQWNRSVSNLISKNDEERIVAGHVLPSIELLGWMKSRDLKRWCDLGSGGGFPAMPLAICGLGESWDLVESRRTKTLFLQRAKGELGLEKVRILSARIEDLPADLAPGAGDTADEAHEPHRQRSGADDAWEGAGEASVVGAGDELALEAGAPDDEAPTFAGAKDPGAAAGGESSSTDVERLRLIPPYDGFTSRATLPLAPTLQVSAPIVRPDGMAFLWKGSRLSQEITTPGDWREWWVEDEVRPLSIEHSVIASFKRNSVK